MPLGSRARPDAVKCVEYDVFDERSIKQDSLKLAADFTGAAWDIATMNKHKIQRPMEHTLTVMSFVYEAKGSNPTIFTADSARALRQAEERITKHPEFPVYCQRQYLAANGSAYECDPAAFSPLKFLYASGFDAAKARAVVSQLKKPAVFEAYKQMGRCFESAAPPALSMTAAEWEATCDPAGEISAADRELARAVSADISSIIAGWDGRGAEPVSDMAALAELVAWLRALPSRASLVDFSVAKGFNSTHLQCQYARSLIMFGGEFLSDASVKLLLQIYTYVLCV